MTKNKVKVNIASKAYTIIGEDSTEHMISVGQMVDTQVRDIATSYPALSVSDRAVLAAINVADEYIKTREKLMKMVEELTQSEQLLIERLETLTREFEELKTSVEEAERQAAEAQSQKMVLAEESAKLEDAESGLKLSESETENEEDKADAFISGVEPNEGKPEFDAWADESPEPETNDSKAEFEDAFYPKNMPISGGAETTEESIMDADIAEPALADESFPDDSGEADVMAFLMSRDSDDTPEGDAFESEETAAEDEEEDIEEDSTSELPFEADEDEEEDFAGEEAADDVEADEENQTWEEDRLAEDVLSDQQSPFEMNETSDEEENEDDVDDDNAEEWNDEDRRSVSDEERESIEKTMLFEDESLFDEPRKEKDDWNTVKQAEEELSLQNETDADESDEDWQGNASETEIPVDDFEDEEAEERPEEYVLGGQTSFNFGEAPENPDEEEEYPDTSMLDHPDYGYRDDED